MNSTGPGKATAKTGMATTSSHPRRELLKLLREVACNRADEHGGRQSVSNLIWNVLERHRDGIEGEAAQ